MKLKAPAKIGILLLGDIAALYAALGAALFLRYGGNFFDEFLSSHFIPFTLIFPFWIIVFYIAGLYDLPRLRNNIDFLKTLLLALAVNASLSIVIFYLITGLGIAPKTNLLIFIGAFALIEAWWRRTFNIRASFREGLVRVLLIGPGERTEKFRNTLADNPQIGYTVAAFMNENLESLDAAHLRAVVRDHSVNLIVVPSNIAHHTEIAKILYELLSLGIEVRTLVDFFEMVYRKVPLDDIRESWFIEHRIGEHRSYDELKRGLEMVFAALLGVALFPLLLIIAFLVRLTSSGPAIYAQTRIGKNNRPFTLYKFRTMHANAEQGGARWASLSDPRATSFGRLLRRTHLDELPQLWNIVRGELSFVGPRPERPEFTVELRNVIPYYDIRSLVHPGVTGWAQISYRYGASIEDAREKLEYELYYIKNRSLIFDLAIAVKTLKMLFVNHV